MGKDPAFLFYPGDYISGTMGMTFEEKGAYIELLMLQFNRGHLQEHIIIRIVGKDIWDVLYHKFTKDENGLFFNIRLEDEQIKRKNYSKSRRNNRGCKANLKPNKSDINKTNIYIIKDLETGNIKIGASVNPKNRLSTLKYKSNKNLELVAIFKNCTIKDEEDVHKHFIDDNIKGDWFELHEEDVIKHMNKHMNKHMENENEDENINTDKDKNSLNNKEEEKKENNIPTETNSHPSKKDLAVKLTCEYYRVNEINHFQYFASISSCLELIHKSGRIDEYIANLKAYMEYKLLTKQQAHGYAKFIGDTEENCEDGIWASQDWVLTLKDYKEIHTDPKDQKHISRINLSNAGKNT